MKRIILALDSFKGSLTSAQAGRAAADGIIHAFASTGAERPETVVVPVGDGGEGTAAALVEGLHGTWHTVHVPGPLEDTVDASYGVSADGATAIMEMASASGLTLIDRARRNPLLTSTMGTGRMMLDALDRGCRTLVMGIGGSATNDGGMGMLAALGARFLDGNGRELKPCGSSLERVATVNLSGLERRLANCRIMVACDVDNPLCGPRGASAVFGPQKGADAAMVRRLDAGMANYARVMAQAVGKDVSERPGAGAAGGLGFAFASVLGAEMMPGIDLVLDVLHFDNIVRGANLVITGEGRLDSQTVMGKTPWGVLQRAKREGVPAAALGGAIAPESMAALMDAGFIAALPVVPGPCALEEAMRAQVAEANLRRTAGQLARLFFHL